MNMLIYNAQMGVGSDLMLEQDLTSSKKKWKWSDVQFISNYLMDSDYSYKMIT